MKMHRIISDDGSQERYGFFCPACNFAHWIRVSCTLAKWTWNEDVNKPTIRPNVLSYLSDGRCHCFVEDGKITFLNDCTHDKKGQTMELPDFENL